MKFVKRRGNKTDSKSTDGDVESQSSSSALSSSPDSSSRPPRSAAGAPPSSSSSTGGVGGAAGLIRKFMLLAARDVTENSSSNYLLTIIKDVISGTILGVFFLMVLIFLDYQNVIQLGSARAFRRAAFELMTDPETVKSIEENIDIKFIPVDVYDSMTEEITRNNDKVANNGGLKQHEEDLANKKAELEGMRKEYDEWKGKGNSILQLDKWCGHCKGGWGPCDGRVKYLMDTYHTPEIKAKVDVMASGKCLLP